MDVEANAPITLENTFIRNSPTCDHIKNAHFAVILCSNGTNMTCHLEQFFWRKLAKCRAGWAFDKSIRLVKSRAQWASGWSGRERPDFPNVERSELSCAHTSSAVRVASAAMCAHWTLMLPVKLRYFSLFLVFRKVLSPFFVKVSACRNQFFFWNRTSI